MNTTHEHGRRGTTCRLLVALCLALSGIFFLASPGAAGTLDATWTAPTTSADGSALADLASYRVYYGTSTSPCGGASFVSVASPSSTPPAGQTVGATLGGLSAGTTYAVAVSAVDTSGNESVCSSAVTAAARASFGVTPTGTLNFGTVNLGSSATQTLTVQNTVGGTVSGTVSVSAPFSVVSGSPFNLVGLNATQTVTLRFTPSTSATVTGNATITAGGDAVTRVLSGTGSGSDAVAPTLAITTPTTAATYATTTGALTLGGTASDNVGVTQVSWTNSRGGSGVATGTTSWSAAGIALQAGSNVLSVTARDASGNTRTASLTVSYDPTAPTVSLTGPAPGTTITGPITLTATASDNVGVVGVQFLLDGAAIGAEQTSGYSLAWNPAGTTNGTHTLSARARDAAGNTAVSAAVAVTIANPQPAGLVAAYAFSEARGTSVTDRSGFANAGTLGTGVTRVAQGRFGSALAFDGSGYVTVPHSASLNLTSGMTLSAWVYPTATSGVRDIVIKEGSNVDIYNLYARNGRGLPESNVYVGGLNRMAEGSTLPVNTWTHVAGTYDGATLRLYVNGVATASVPVSGAMPTSTGALRIGGNSIWGEYFQGRLDEVRVYNRALSVAEIQNDMTTPIDSAPAPDTTAPVVAIVEPTSAATYATSAASLALVGTASDNVGVTQVTWASSAGAGTATGTTSWSVASIVLQPGSNVLTVTARDAAGNTAARSLTVTYTPMVALTVARAGTGSGTVASTPAGINCGSACSASYASGAAVTLTAAPAADSVFAGWSGGGCSGTGACTVTVSAATTVTATFTLKSFDLTVGITGTGSGSVYSNPAGIECHPSTPTTTASFPSGTVVTLTATPYSNTVFVGWTGGGCSGTGPCTVTVSQALSVTAAFTLKTFPLTVGLAGTGSGSVSSAPAGIACGSGCSATYDAGTAVTLTATPAANSVFAGWTGGGCSGTGTCAVALSAATTVTATFNVAPTTPPGAPGSVTVSQLSADATGVTFAVSWGAGSGATSYRYTAAFSNGSAMQQGTVTGTSMQLRMPYYSTGAASTGFVCVVSVNAAGQTSTSQSCNALKIPKRP